MAVSDQNARGLSQYILFDSTVVVTTKKSKTKIRQSTAPINMKLTRVTPAGLEVFGEVPTAFEFLVSELPSQKNSNGNFKLYIKIIISRCYLL